MKKFNSPLYVYLIAITLAFVFALGTHAQVVRQGNTFVRVDSLSQGTKTEYKYQEGGKTYSIYLSRNGRAYIVKVSKKGKEYKKYLPEISKVLSNELKIDTTCTEQESKNRR